MGVIVKKPGLLTSIQDLGRTGYQRSGIIVSGSMDILSTKLANLLVGNDINEAVLEVTLTGPTLHFSMDSVISICGASLSPTLNNQPLEMNRPYYVREGDILKFGRLEYGSRCYIAFKGGIQVEDTLGSKSTCLPAGFGGINGRSLRKDDILPLFPLKPIDISRLNWKLSNGFNREIFNNEPVRFITGRQSHLFDKESLEKFRTSEFTLTKDINRMGYRLNGPILNLSKKQEILTEGVTFGTVQVPSSGQPIILMADRQTTGGYPKIAQIISADLPKLAQLKSGDIIRFTEVSFQEAQNMLLKHDAEVQALRKMIIEKWKVVESNDNS